MNLLRQIILEEMKPFEVDLGFEIKRGIQEGADLYIQRIGEVGKPLKEPITSVFSVFLNKDTWNTSYFYYLIEHLFKQNKFQAYKKGTAQEHITLRDVYKVIYNHLLKVN